MLIKGATEKHIPCSHVLWGPFYWHGLTLIPAWISNHMPIKVWDEVTYPFPICPQLHVEVWEWVSDFIPYFIKDVIAYTCWDLKLIHVSKRAPSSDWVGSVELMDVGMTILFVLFGLDWCENLSMGWLMFECNEHYSSLWKDLEFKFKFIKTTVHNHMTSFCLDQIFLSIKMIADEVSPLHHLYN